MSTTIVFLPSFSIFPFGLEYCILGLSDAILGYDRDRGIGMLQPRSPTEPFECTKFYKFLWWLYWNLEWKLIIWIEHDFIVGIKSINILNVHNEEERRDLLSSSSSKKVLVMARVRVRSNFYVLYLKKAFLFVDEGETYPIFE